VPQESLPPWCSLRQQFEVAAGAGFDGIEIRASAQRDLAAEVAEAASATGLAIHSVKSAAQWNAFLSSGDPAEVDRAARAVLDALQLAHTLGADTVLMLAARVDAAVSYAQAYERSQRVIRERLLPAAHDLGIVLAVENVWSGFLLSPLEFARYVDEFESPWVRVYFDTGNAVFGRPEHWIDTLGPRIVKLHAKDFRFRNRGTFRWPPIGRGDVDWRAVHAALQRCGFRGWTTVVEIEPLLTRASIRAEHLLQRRHPALATRIAPWLRQPELSLAKRRLRGAIRRYRNTLER
jgi:L-ribulose-5-phosphate 3-epimerase